MALNFSPHPFVNGYFVEGEKREGCGLPRHMNRDFDDCFDYKRERVDRRDVDIIDLLPSDPFGMDISTTFTAITGWLEDLKVDYGGYGRNSVDTSKDEYSLFAGFNFIWNKALRFQSFPGNVVFDDRFNTAFRTGNCALEGELGFGSVRNAEDTGSVSVNSGSTSAFAPKIEVSRDSAECCSNKDGGAPHEGFVYALNYLGVRDLLSVERVCSYLHSTVRRDPFLWRSIHIDQPLNEKITDDVLLQLTSRAQGNLQCLSLVECPRITDAGLKHVLDNNSRLTKLCVPGCTRLGIDNIVNSLKAIKSNKGAPGIKHLRIGGLYGVTDEHFEELKILLGADSIVQQNVHKPHLYNRKLYLLCDDDNAIDIELCPKCQKLRLVYDCPAGGCQSNDHASQVCRACTLCIPRCVQCGRCINDGEYEETFCLELLCSNCFKQSLNCQENQGGKAGFTTDLVHHEPSYNSCFHG